MNGDNKFPPPTLWGVWSEANDEAPEWFETKELAVEHAKNIVSENFGVRVHLLKAASVGTIEVPAIPVTTGEMTATRTPPAAAGAA